EIGTDEAPSDRVAEVLRRHVGLELRGVEPVGSVEHLFTHRRLALDVFRARPVPGGRVRREGFVAHRWLRPEALLELAHAGATRKALALFGVTNEVSARAARDPRDRTPRRPRGASARP
ncbi:MAG: hypothetical protein KC616_26390, partial [Myxococcales bacterium]|nr:hypothetical protein [Myxococcales bacterium]